MKIILCDSPLFSQRRKNFRCNPVFEAFGFLKFTAEDERVETGFVNDGHLLGSAKVALNWGVLFIFVVYMYGYSISCFRISQRRCYIFPHKPWLSINLNAAQISEFWMIKDLTLGSGRRRGDCGVVVS